MSFIATAGAVATYGAAAGAVMKVGGALFSGFQAAGNKDAINKAKTAADDVFEQQKALAERTNEASLQRADQTRDYGVGKANLVARSAITDLNKSKDIVGKTNMAFGTANNQSKNIAGSMWDAYKLSGQNLASAYQFTTETADIALEKSIAAAEKERQSTLAELEAQPDSFLEGLFS
tara:strand:- start:47 stop:577 length:531 start_codon:yes stop_codon:yes gene_type:complete